MSKNHVRRVKEILDDEFGTRVFSVEDDVVWVSGMNADCIGVAHRMALTLTIRYGYPSGLPFDDEAVKHGGVQFRWEVADER